MASGEIIVSDFTHYFKAKNALLCTIIIFDIILVVQGDASSSTSLCSVVQTCEHVPKYQPIGFGKLTHAEANNCMQIHVGT